MEMAMKKGTASRRPKKESLAHDVFIRFIKNKNAAIGMVIFIILLLLAIFAEHLTPYDYAKLSPKERFMFPCAEHWLGTDELGRDLLTRILVGTRYSISIGFTAIGTACVIGSIIGAFCGYFGGKLDMFFMRFLDIFQSLPGILLTITFAAALGTGIDKTIMAMTITRIPGATRMMRSSIMRVRSNEYLEAAEAVGCGPLRRIFKHAVPNSLAPVIVDLTMDIASSILMLSSLSYIGLGIQPPNPEWGALLNAGRQYFRSHPYLILFPGLFIAITVLCLNLIGDGLRDALDPRLKQ